MKKSGLFILTAALGLIVLGVFLKQPAQVMSKAVRICLECIGIG